MMFRVTNRQTFIAVYKKMFIVDTTGNEQQHAHYQISLTVGQ